MFEKRLAEQGVERVSDFLAVQVRMQGESVEADAVYDYLGHSCSATTSSDPSWRAVTGIPIPSNGRD